MRKLTMLAAAASLILVGAPAWAHPEDEGSDYRRGPSTAEMAQLEINNLVAMKKLPASWTRARMVNVDYRARNGGQYVLLFENAAIKQPAKRRLYVVMTISGGLVSTGYKLS